MKRTGFVQDLRHATRTLHRHVGFSVVVILSLALAIALNTTMYSVLDALVHPRVDLRDPASILRIRLFGDYRQRVSLAARDSLLLAGAPAISDVAWFSVSTFGGEMTVGDRYAEGGVLGVDTSYFRLLGPHMVAGRALAGADATAPVPSIVISQWLARTLFTNEQRAIGATITMRDNTRFVVVGVLSPYSTFGDDHASAWVLSTKARGAGWGQLVRVRPGTTRAQFQAQLDLVAGRIAALAGEGSADVAYRIKLPGRDEVNLRTFHYALMFAVVAVLLVACANVANMQLARGIGRGRELAVRMALGAARSRIVAHLLAETVLLAVIGLALGLVLTLVGTMALRATIPPSVGEYIVEPEMSWRVMLFAIGATTVCILLVGLMPAIRISRVDPNELLKSGAGTGATRMHRRQYGYLVAVELALALTLMSGAAVMIRGAIVSAASWIGIDASHLASGFAAVSIPQGTRAPTAPLLDSIVQQLRAQHGVTSAALQRGGDYEHGGITIADSNGMRVLPVFGSGPLTVTSQYFRTVGMPILTGSDFPDGARDHPAIIIDEYTAKKLWPNANPVGSLTKFGDAASHRPFVPVIGVAGQYGPDGKIKPVNLAEVGGTIGQVYYLSGPADSISGGKRLTYAQLAVRAAGNPATLVPALRRIGIRNAQTMDDLYGISSRRESRRFLAALFTLFGTLGLGLAAFGVYGVVAHSVAQRRRELGVRIALGATARDVLRAVLRESVIIALIGTAAGLLMTKYSVMMVGQFAAEDDIYNASLFAGVAAFLAAMAAVAAFTPAWRATRLDPTECLRSE